MQAFGKEIVVGRVGTRGSEWLRSQVLFSCLCSVSDETLPSTLGQSAGVHGEECGYDQCG